MTVASPFELVAAADQYSGTDWKTLYTVPAGSQAFVKSIIASNTAGSNSITPTLQLVKGSQQVQLAAPSLAANAATNLLAGTLTLGPGDSLRQKTTLNFIKFTEPAYPGAAESRVTGLNFNGIDRLNGNILVYGSSSSGVDPYNSVLFTSPDGNAWTWRDFNTGETTGRGIYCAAYGGGVYAIGCDGGIIFTSTDLINWTKRTTPITGIVYSIAYGQGKFIAVGSGSTNATCMASSTDGAAWSAVTAPESSASVPMIAYDATLNMFAVTLHSGGSGYLYTSANGTAWTQRFSQQCWGVAAAGGKFYSCTYSTGAVLVSTDGVNFYSYGLAVSPQKNHSQSFKFVLGKLYSMSSSYIYVTADGITGDLLYQNQMSSGALIATDGVKILLVPYALSSAEMYKLTDISRAASQSCSFTASIVKTSL